MTLKERVEIELKKQKRSLSWLALKIEMTVDGLRGSDDRIRGSEEVIRLLKERIIELLSK